MQQVEVRELPKEQCTESLSNHSDVQCTPSEPLLSLDKPQLSLSPRPLLRNGPLGKNEMGSQEDQREDGTYIFTCIHVLCSVCTWSYFDWVGLGAVGLILTG